MVPLEGTKKRKADSDNDFVAAAPVDDGEEDDEGGSQER